MLIVSLYLILVTVAVNGKCERITQATHGKQRTMIGVTDPTPFPTLDRHISIATSASHLSPKNIVIIVVFCIGAVIVSVVIGLFINNRRHQRESVTQEDQSLSLTNS